MRASKHNRKCKLTVSLDRETARKAKIIVAQRSMSLGDFLAEQVETLVRDQVSYERAKRRAIALLDRGFHLGGAVRLKRDDLHERKKNPIRQQ